MFGCAACPAIIILLLPLAAASDCRVPEALPAMDEFLSNPARGKLKFLQATREILLDRTE